MMSNSSDPFSPPLAPGKPCKCKTRRSKAVCKSAALLLWSCHRQLVLSSSPGSLALIPNVHFQAPASKRVKRSRAGHGRCSQRLLGTIQNQRRHVVSGLGWLPLAKAVAWCAAVLLLLLSSVKVLLPPKSLLYPSFPTRQPWFLTH